MGSLEHLVARLAPSTSPSGLNFSIFKLHTDFINCGTFPKYFLDEHEELQDQAGVEGEAEGEGAKRACLLHHNHKRGRCPPTWFVVTHKLQPPHQWAGQKIKFYSLRRGNDEQSIARHCLDGAVVWCPCFFMVLFRVITAVVVWWGWLWSMEVLRWKSNTVWWRLVTMTHAAGTKSLICDDWVPKNNITP